MEALKAQAVCARTYGYRYILDGALEDFHADVDDSVIYQVYNNIAPQETTDRAIAETKGEILTYNDEPITAYFFSTSCGYTSTDEVWNTEEGQAYLKSIYMNEDEVDRSMETEEAFAAFISSNTDVTYEQEEKWYRWRVTLPYAYLNERIAGGYPSLGTFVDMQIQKRGEGGAVEELLIRGSEDTLLLSSEYDIRAFFAPGDYTISTNDGEDSIMSGLLPSAYFTYEPVADGITFIGGGYGHGVGLSQNGANNLAKNSKTYSEILDFFYQNVQITRLEN
jgi:stage II sporulation protein D